MGIYGIYLNKLNNTKLITPIANSNMHVSSAEPNLETNIDNIDVARINIYGGYLLRIKPADVDEGGLASGYSVLGAMNLV